MKRRYGVLTILGIVMLLLGSLMLLLAFVGSFYSTGYTLHAYGGGIMFCALGVGLLFWGAWKSD